MSEVRDIYNIGNPQSIPEMARTLSGIFIKIAQRLDRVEGLRDTPTFYKDIFKFITSSGLTATNVMRATGTDTAQFGALVNANLPIVDHEHGGLEADVSAYDGLTKISGGATSQVSVTATGEDLLDGLVNIYDEAGELIHQFHVDNIPYLGELTNFYRETITIWPKTDEMYKVGDACINFDGVDPGIKLGYGTWQCVATGNWTLT